MDDEGYDHPIYYISRQLPSVEMNYTVTEGEGLGVIFCFEEISILLTWNESYVGDRPSSIGLSCQPIKHDGKNRSVNNFTSKI